MRTSGIYKAYFTNDPKNRVYVGSAIDFENRWEVHLSQSRNNIHHSILFQRAFNKYGEENLVFEILEIVEDENNLLKAEQIWLDIVFTVGNRLNISPTAGSQLGLKRSDEAKARISAARKGRKHTEEHSANISKAKKGTKLTEEHKAKVSAAKKGTKHTAETKAKMAAAKKGKKRKPYNKGIDNRPVGN